MIFPKEIRTYIYSNANDFLSYMQGCNFKIKNISDNHFEIRFEKLVLSENDIDSYWIKFNINIGIRDLQFDKIIPENLVVGFSTISSFLMQRVDEMWFKYRGYGHNNAIPCWEDVKTAIVAEAKTYYYFEEIYGSDRKLCKLQELSTKKIDILFEQIKKLYSEIVEPEIKEKANICYLNTIANTPFDNYIHSNDFGFSGDRIMRKLILARLAKNPEYDKIYEELKNLGDSIQERTINEQDEELVFSIKNFNVRLNKIHRDLQELKF
jgi:hypothetical protein